MTETDNETLKQLRVAWLSASAIDAFMLQRPPEALNEDVVQAAPLAVH